MSWKVVGWNPGAGKRFKSLPRTILLLIRRVELEVNLTTGPTLTNLFVTYLSEVDQQTVSLIFCAQVSYRFVHLHVGLWRATFYLSSPSSITGLTKPKHLCCISNSLTIEFCLPPKAEFITMKTFRHHFLLLEEKVYRIDDRNYWITVQGFPTCQ